MTVSSGRPNCLMNAGEGLRAVAVDEADRLKNVDNAGAVMGARKLAGGSVDGRSESLGQLDWRLYLKTAVGGILRIRVALKQGEPGEVVLLALEKVGNLGCQCLVSGLQLHRAARTFQHARIQSRLNVRSVILSVRWCDPDCRATCKGGGWKNQEQPEKTKQKRKPRTRQRPSVIDVGHLDFPFRNNLLDGKAAAYASARRVTGKVEAST
jgi:hypothetical protein